MSIKRVITLIVCMLAVLILVIIVNTLLFSSRQANVEAVAGIEIDELQVAERLSAAIKLATVSSQDAESFDAGAFQKLHQLMADAFPRVGATLETTTIGHHSLLYKWPGTEPALKPVTYLAHLDVVPVDPATEQAWAYGPFSGAIADGYIWGRGALDDKSSVFALLEAVEHLILQGFVPRRTLYFAFGHDEELGGRAGAAMIAEYFRQRGISSWFTLDEGMLIVDERLSPAKQRTAIIGVAEKGYATLRLDADAEGGHSSLPAPQSAVGRLAKAVVALESEQMPSRLSGPSGALFDYIGPEMGLLKRVLFANRWLFEGVILSALEQKKSTAAMVRTTTALTMFNAGLKENVLPSQARALVNFRILPGDDSEQVLSHAREVVDDPAVAVNFMNTAGTREPSKISAIDTPAFQLLGKTVKQVFDNALFAPGLVLAGTDTRHYEGVADNNYRFAPIVFGPEDLTRIHGVNERIGIQDYGLMIKFYAQLIQNVDAVSADERGAR